MPRDKVDFIAGLFEAYNYEQISVGNTAVGFTAANLTDSDNRRAKRVIVRVEDAQLRYRYDGTDPASTVGMLLNPMDTLVLIGTSNINNFRAIRAGATNSEINVTYEK